MISMFYSIMQKLRQNTEKKVPKEGHFQNHEDAGNSIEYRR